MDRVYVHKLRGLFPSSEDLQAFIIGDILISTFKQFLELIYVFRYFYVIVSRAGF